MNGATLSQSPCPDPNDSTRVKGVRIRTVVGVDVGQKQDHTAVVVIERHDVTFIDRDPVTWEHRTQTGYILSHVERIPLGTTYPDIVERVRDIVMQIHGLEHPALVVDATGVGAPVVDLLRNRGLRRNLVPVTITGGHSVTHGQNSFGVPKRDLITGLQVAFENRSLEIARHIGSGVETLIRELMAMRCETSEGGHERFGVWRSGLHDDLVLAAALAWWGTRRQDLPGIWGTRRLL